VTTLASDLEPGDKIAFDFPSPGNHLGSVEVLAKRIIDENLVHLLLDTNDEADRIKARVVHSSTEFEVPS